MEVEVQLKEETCNGAGQQLGTETRARRCGNCRKAGHNTHSCRIVVEMLKEAILSSFNGIYVHWWQCRG